ncbi:MAG: glycosyltransferase family 39 protein [Chloroflexi bacterium]|nr:glycosyltransferase family 39 protein [Chloroflexota bacterium]
MAILCGAFALRLYGLARQSLWWDEAFSIQLARQPLSAITFGDFHPPLYHYLLHFWINLAGYSEFSARYFSVVAGMLLLPFTYRAVLLLFDQQQPTAVLTMALLAIAPAQWWYSQEARMYIWLALAFMALVWLYARLIHVRKLDVRLTDMDQAPVWLWGIWAAVEWLAMFTHYFAVLGIIALNLLLAGQLLLGRNASGWRREQLRRWLMATCMAVVAYLPWLWLAGSRISSYAPEAAERPVLKTFAFQTWQAYLVGSPTLVGSDQRLINLGYVLAAFLAVIALVLLWRRNDRRPAFALLWCGMVPLALAYILFQIRPGFTPRHVIAYGIPWLILLARGAVLALAKIRPVSAGQTGLHVAWIGGLRTLGGAGLVVLPAALSLLAFSLIFSNPHYQRDNVRGMAQDIASQALSGDVIIFDYDDPAFAYYYRGQTQVVTLNVGDDDTPLLAALKLVLRPGQQAFWISWHQADRDKRRLIPFILAESGSQQSQQYYDTGLLVRRFVLDQAPEGPQLQSVAIDFGDLRLTTAQITAAGATGSGLPIALEWQLVHQTGRNLKVSLQLRDPYGRVVTLADQPLVSGGPGLGNIQADNSVIAFAGQQTARPLSMWGAAESAVNYYTLPLPPGLPPITYRLEVSVYDEGGEALDVRDKAGAPAGRDAYLGDVTVRRGTIGLPEVWSGLNSQDMRILDASPAPGLSLLGAIFNDTALQGGGELWTRFLWQAQQNDLPDYTAHVRLVQEVPGSNFRVITEAGGKPVYGLYPTSRWIAQESVLDYWMLQVPPDTPPGKAQLQVSVGVSSPGDGNWVNVGEVTLDAAKHTFEPPLIQYALRASSGAGIFGGKFELLGCSIESTALRAGAPFTVTLYWRARETGFGAPPYTVFTHLLDASGKLIAQHDGPPVGGTRPTTSWVKGEIITDRHELQFINSDYQGAAQMEVGLYDSGTIERLMRENGENHLIVPLNLEVK